MPTNKEVAISDMVPGMKYKLFYGPRSDKYSVLLYLGKNTLPEGLDFSGRPISGTIRFYPEHIQRVEAVDSDAVIEVHQKVVRS